jgi:hypothetical protein
MPVAQAKANARHCQLCGKTLPDWYPRRRLYCDTRCRKRIERLRARRARLVYDREVVRRELVIARLNGYSKKAEQLSQRVVELSNRIGMLAAPPPPRLPKGSYIIRF